MPGENIGGLNYEINITGDFESKLAAFESRVDKLSKKSAQAAKKSGESSTPKKKRSLLTVEEQQEQKSLENRLKKLQRFNAERLRLSKAQVKDERKVFEDRAKAQIASEKQQEKSRLASRKTTKDQSKDEKKLFDDRAKAQIAFEKTQERARLVAQRVSEQNAKALKATKEGLAKQRQAEDVGFQARQRNIASAKELKIKQSQINQLVREQGITQRAAADQVGLTSAQAKQLKLNMFDAQHAARQFLFTFRRLVGILAVFTLARKLAQNISLAVNEMSRFNAEIELAEISIASIVSSVGQVRDAQGNLVTGADAFAASLQASSKILAQLKKDAIGSIATFEALVKAYQVAIGPGLAAGLDLDQVRVLSKRLAEGAISLGVPLNQLSEEIRSLLQGTATARNTRIAVLFGGAKEANEAIRNAKEQGNLYEVLTEKLQGVAQGADAATQSFEVLQSNLQDSIQLLLAEGGIEYFDQLKESLLGLTQAISTVDDDGNIGFTPEAISVVKALSSGLSDLISNVREFTDTKTVFTQLATSISILSGILSAAAPLAVSLFTAIASGVSSVLVPLNILLSDLKDLVGALKNSSLGRLFLDVSKYVTATAVGLLLWRKIIIQLGLLVGTKGLFGAFKLIQASIVAVSASSGGFNAKLVISNLLALALGKQMDAVALKAALASGGLTLLIGGLVYVIARMTVLKDRTGDMAELMGDAGISAEDLAFSIEGASGAMEEGLKTAEDWRDTIEEAVNELIRAKGLAGLSGDSKDLSSNLLEARIEINKQTEALRLQKAQREQQLRLLQREKEELQQILITRNQLQVSSTGEVFITVGTEESARLNEIKTEQLALNSNLDDINEDINQKEAKSLELLDLQTQAIQERVSLQSRQQIIDKEDAGSALKIAKLDADRLNKSVAKFSVIAAESKVLQASVALSQKERDIAFQTLEARVEEAKALPESEASIRIINALEVERGRLLDVNKLSQEEELAALKEKGRELERQQKLLSGTFSDALIIGLEDFSRELPAIGEQIAEIVSGSLTDLAGVVGDVFKDAIDPRTNADLSTAFGEFFLNLAGQFVEAITSQLINQALGELGLGVAKDVATTANTAAITANSGALAANTLAMTSLQGTLLALQTTGGVQSGFGLGGGLLGIFAKGGPVQRPKAFASGGDVGGIPRPSNIPASDTVPAWLTPGEFVIKKSSVQKYGTGILSALNNGVLNPSSFSATGLALGGMVKGIQSFAAGGSVARSMPKQSGQQQTTVVLPVLPTTENTMEQIRTGGRNSFSNGVNNVEYIGDPNRSGRWGG